MRRNDPEVSMTPERVEELAPRRHTAGEVALIAIVVAYAGILLAGPLVAILWGAFGTGIVAFLVELGSRDAIEALKLTLIISVGATILNTVLGVAIAMVLVRDEFPGKRFINGLVDLPFAVSPVIAGFMLILLFGRGGWFTPIVEALGTKIVFALPGMLLATTFVALPFVVREVMPVLAQAGVDQELAALTLGAGPLRTFWHVTLPSIRWGLLYGISLTFARAVGEFGAVLVVSGGVSRSTETATLFIFRSLDDRNYTGAYAMAVVLALLSCAVLVAMEFFKNRTERGAA
jgi:sulfate/thiosulfate transport system permease protein